MEAFKSLILGTPPTRTYTASATGLLTSANNLSDVADAATARTNLGVAAVVGTSTDNAVVRFNGTGGAQQNSGVTIDDNNNMTVPGVTIALGPGGTGTDNSILTLDGSNAASYGPYMVLKRNGSNIWQNGSYSGIQGGASSDWLLYNSTAAGEAIRVSSSGFTTTFGAGGTGTNNAIAVLNGSSASSYGAQLRFNRNGSQKWDMGHHSGIQGGASDDLLIYNQTAGNESFRIAAATGNLKFGAYGAGTLTTDSSGNVSATSDERAKANLTPYTKGLAEVVRLTPKSYHWRAETGLNTDDVVVSLTAQDLLAAGLGEAVNTERTVPVMEAVELDGKTVQQQKRDAQGNPVFERVEADYYTVSDRAVIAALVNAVKTLAAEVEALKAR